MALAAQLDEHSRLIGKQEFASEEDVPRGWIAVQALDLPTDGSYKWSQKHRAFLPTKSDVARRSPPPMQLEAVVFLLAKELGNRVPTGVRDWMEWYTGEPVQHERDR